jgi:hypothetical protein
MNTFTKEQQARGGRNGKRGKTASSYGKKLVAAFLGIVDPEEQVALLKKYSELPTGVELPKEIHFQLYQMNMEANRRLQDTLLLEDEKQNLALERLVLREEISNRKLILSKQLNEMNTAQRQVLYESTLATIRAELIDELTPVIRAEIELELELAND